VNGLKGHKTTSVLLLHAREVVVAQMGSKLHTNHLCLALLLAREVVVGKQGGNPLVSFHWVC